MIEVSVNVPEVREFINDIIEAPKKIFVHLPLLAYSRHLSAGKAPRSTLCLCPNTTYLTPSCFRMNEVNSVKYPREILYDTKVFRFLDKLLLKRKHGTHFALMAPSSPTSRSKRQASRLILSWFFRDNSASSSVVDQLLRFLRTWREKTSKGTIS